VDFTLDLNGEETVGAGGGFVHFGFADDSLVLGFLHEFENVGGVVYLFFGEASVMNELMMCGQLLVSCYNMAIKLQQLGCDSPAKHSILSLENLQLFIICLATGVIQQITQVFIINLEVGASDDLFFVLRLSQVFEYSLAAA
jgi:hypothetical protein